jgi:F-type H+-transporting ATPase subunit delta
VSVQARPQDYAAAIYDLALETWTRQLGELQKTLQADARLRATLDDVQIPTGEKLDRLEQALPEGLGGEIRKFVGTLLEAGQLDQLDSILVELARLARRGPERRLARVTSAVPLTDQEQEALRGRIVERFGTDLEFRFEVDPSIIGGVHLRVGDQVIDGSVAGRLAALRDSLTA